MHGAVRLVVLLLLPPPPRVSCVRVSLPAGQQLALVLVRVVCTFVATGQGGVVTCSPSGSRRLARISSTWKRSSSISISSPASAPSFSVNSAAPSTSIAAAAKGEAPVGEPLVGEAARLAAAAGDAAGGGAG